MREECCVVLGELQAGRTGQLPASGRGYRKAGVIEIRQYRIPQAGG
jgi:hypothetical protein